MTTLLCKNHSPDTCTEPVIKHDNKMMVQEGMKKKAVVKTLKVANTCFDFCHIENCLILI